MSSRSAMAGEHGDLLRDAVALVVRELMEAEVAQLTGAGRGERRAERVTHLNGYRPRVVGDAGRRDRAGDPAEAVGAGVLPELSGAAAALRAGDRRGRDGGLRQRRLDPQGRPAGRAARASRAWTRTASAALCRELDEHVERFRDAAAGGRLPVSVAGRQAASRSATAAAWSPRRWSSPTPSTSTGGAR